ncbi:MAG: hypothetical protein KKF56_01620 [Nanoarchaeota archaeon]|nr:hypothetical protein [Nanoarchaeota archaeon]
MALKSQKHVFWQALLVAIFIFAVGFSLGIVMEKWRAGVVYDDYDESDVDFLDLKIQSDLLGDSDFSCERAVEENINFGDRIFAKAVQLQEFEESQRLSDSLKQIHKKYDLLRTLFWINSIKIKQRCDSDYHNVVYLYNYEPSLDERAVQVVFSNFLKDLKSEMPGKIILIPIAANMGLNSLDYMMEEYGVDRFPAIVIDEDVKIYEIDELRMISNIINETL